MTDVVRAAGVAPRPWGEGCTSWDLLDGDDLRVTEEHMPPGTAEVAHDHGRARQFFYVVSGALSIERDGTEHALAAGDGLEIPPGARHRVRNDGPDDARFLVVAAPSTKHDRH